MTIAPEQIIEPLRASPRWRARERGHSAHPATDVWSVSDLHPRMQERSLWLVTPSYRDIPADRLDWDAPSLRRAFEEMAEVLVSGPTFFPEPIDFFHYHGAPDAGGQPEPAVVYALPSGFTLRHLGRNESKRVDNLKRLCIGVANCLRVLHDHRAVARQVPLASLVLSHTTYRPYFTGFQTLRPMEGFPGYNPAMPDLHPSREWAAPECFQSDGKLSPATDIYALGRLLLAYLGVQLTQQPLGATELDATLSGLGLPELWARLLGNCLHPHPQNRFDNCGELLRFLASGGTASSGRGAPRRRPPAVRREDRPRSALLVFADMRLKRGMRFDYGKLIAHLQPQHSLDLKVAFAPEQRDTNNPFFALLRNRFGFEVVTFDLQADRAALLRNTLSQRLAGLPQAVVAGSCNDPLVKELLQGDTLKGMDLTVVAVTGKAPKGVRVVGGDRFVKQTTTRRSK